MVGFQMVPHIYPYNNTSLNLNLMPQSFYTALHDPFSAICYIRPRKHSVFLKSEFI